jgi:hypothetical protein
LACDPIRFEASIADALKSTVGKNEATAATARQARLTGDQPSRR